MDLGQLEVFLTVAREGKFSRAAEKLHRTQSAVSQSIHKLEQDIGEPLFDLPLSGWYWQVTRLDTPKPELRASRSLWDSSLPSLEALAVPADAASTRGCT